VCPSSVVSFSGFVFDLCQQQELGAKVPIDGVQVATLQPYSATLTSDGGLYTICIPAGVPTTLVFTAPSYLTLYLPELILSTSSLPSALGHIALPCLQGLEDYAHELPALNPAQPMIFAQIDSLAPTQPPCGGFNDAGISALAGWTFTDSLAEGGAGEGGPWPVGYLDTSNDLQPVSATFSTGEAIIYDIDPGALYVSVQASNASLDALCAPLNVDLGVDGRVYVAPNAVSVYPWIIP
jgi:hypothetical protein